MSKAREYIILAAVLGLTVISVGAGFSFYKALFDETTAIICCIIFETLRLTCLWSLAVYGWIRRIVAIPVYILVALTCAFASIASFHARILESHAEALKPAQTEISRKIELTKRAYVKMVMVDLKALDEKIDQCNRNLAWNPQSAYWKNRLEQLTIRRQEIVAARDRFLNQIPTENKEAWISQNASLLGLELEPTSSTPHGSAAMTKAIQELWNVSEVAAKKVVSTIIVVTVECGIILLSLFAKKNGRSKGKDKQRILAILRERFADDEIRAFLERSADYFKKRGRLPLSRELGKRQREIRKTISDGSFGRGEIRQLFEELRNGDL